MQSQEAKHPWGICCRFRSPGTLLSPAQVTSYRPGKMVRHRRALQLERWWCAAGNTEGLEVSSPVCWGFTEFRGVSAAKPGCWEMTWWTTVLHLWGADCLLGVLCEHPRKTLIRVEWVTLQILLWSYVGAEWRTRKHLVFLFHTEIPKHTGRGQRNGTHRALWGQGAGAITPSARSPRSASSLSHSWTCLSCEF